jgi:hypothetical protein
MNLGTFVEDQVGAGGLILGGGGQTPNPNCRAEFFSQLALTALVTSNNSSVRSSFTKKFFERPVNKMIWLPTFQDTIDEECISRP